MPDKITQKTQQKFESNFGFYAIFLLVLVFGALTLGFLVLTFSLTLPLTNSFGQIGNYFGTLLNLIFLGFIFFKFLGFLLTKEVLILKENSIFINNGKNETEINYSDINYIIESYSRTRTNFIFRNRYNKYSIKLESKLGNFYMPPKIIANLNYTGRIREFLLTKKELQGKFIADNLGWKIYKISSYLAFIILGILLTVAVFTFIYIKLNNIG